MHDLNDNSNLCKKKKSYILVKINSEMGKDFQALDTILL